MKVNSIDRSFMRIAKIFRLKHKIISDENQNPYLLRIYVFRSKKFSVYFHRFFRGDHDPDLHDHPWPWFSLVLSGGYWEQIVTGKIWRRPGSFALRSPKHLHRVELDRDKTNNKPVWTLFISGKKKFNSDGIPCWGFMTQHGWQRFDHYLTQKRRLEIKEKRRLKTLTI